MRRHDRPRAATASSAAAVGSPPLGSPPALLGAPPAAESPPTATGAIEVAPPPPSVAAAAPDDGRERPRWRWRSLLYPTRGVDKYVDGAPGRSACCSNTSRRRCAADVHRRADGLLFVSEHLDLTEVHASALKTAFGGLGLELALAPPLAVAVGRVAQAGAVRVSPLAPAAVADLEGALGASVGAAEEIVDDASRPGLLHRCAALAEAPAWRRRRVSCGRVRPKFALRRGGVARRARAPHRLVRRRRVALRARRAAAARRALRGVGDDRRWGEAARL